MKEMLNEIKNLCSKNSKELGWVHSGTIKNAIEKNEIIIEKHNDKIIGVLIYHLRKNNEITLYYIVVDKEYRNQGYGRKMINKLIGKGYKITLKCPEDLEANNFYKSVGFNLIRVEKGRKRRLNVWKWNVE